MTGRERNGVFYVDPATICFNCGNLTSILASLFGSKEERVAVSAGNIGRNTVIVYDDGSIEIRVGGSISWRNNNPGNMISGVGGYQAIGSNGGFAVFADYETGFAAMVANLTTDSRYTTSTVGDAIATWAPAVDGNDPVNYANTVAAWTGLSVNTPMNSLTPLQINSVANAIQRFEGWRPGDVAWLPWP